MYVHTQTCLCHIICILLCNHKGEVVIPCGTDSRRCTAAESLGMCCDALQHSFDCIAALVLYLLEEDAVTFHFVSTTTWLLLLRRIRRCSDLPAGLPAKVFCNGTLPPAPANSTGFPSGCRGLVAGAVCRTNCTRGFTGNISITCAESGTWSTPAGTCRRGKYS